MALKVYNARVTDNKDPKMIGRLKFVSKELMGGKQHPRWAEPVFPICDASADGESGSEADVGVAGVFFVPPIGHLIHILIDDENIDHPLWIGGHPPDLMKIPPWAATDYPKRGGIQWKTVGGLWFEPPFAGGRKIVHLEGHEYIEIWTQLEDITIEAEEGVVEIKAGERFTVEAEEGIEMSAGSKIEISGPSAYILGERAVARVGDKVEQDEFGDWRIVEGSEKVFVG